MTKQIEQLRTEAAQDGDLSMMAICDLALGKNGDEFAEHLPLYAQNWYLEDAISYCSTVIEMNEVAS